MIAERACDDCGDARSWFDLRRTMDGALLCADCYDRYTVLSGVAAK